MRATDMADYYRDEAKNERLDLMAARDLAIARGDWAEMNRLTNALADLPMRGVKPLTDADKRAYAEGKR